jgi:F0F1-type ATP synthase assembly protein I
VPNSTEEHPSLATGRPVSATNDRSLVDASQRRELTQQMHRSTGSYELVLSPVLLALIGYGLDRLFGTVPIITVLFAVLGLVGAIIKIYFGYRAEMEAHEANGPWAQ